MVTRLSRVASFVLPALVVALGSAHSDARADKFTHSAEVKPPIKLTERSRPVARTDQPAGPSTTSTEILNVQGLLGTIHAEQIALLKDLIEHTPDSNADEKADYYFRLGEIYARSHRFHRLKAIEAEIALGKEVEPTRRVTLNATIAFHQQQAKAALLGSIDTYQALMNKPIFARYPKIDTAMFYFAYTLQSANYRKEARAAYDRLLKNYPNSRYVPEAHLAFAEYHFDARQLADAEARYRQVLKFPQSSVYLYAQYKLGWVDLNLGKPTEALQAFNQVAQQTRSDPDKAVLHRAAKHDFVRAYAEIGKADKALPAFRRIDAGRGRDGDSGLAMLEILGDLYLDQGKHDKAIYVFRQLMTERPTSPNVCLWQHSVARAMLAAGTNDDKVHEVEQLVRLYVALRDRKALPKAASIECHDAAAEMSGQLARAYHQELAKAENPALPALAGRLYRAYLGAFHDAPDFGETQYFAAELAWVSAERETAPRLATQRWEEVARAFTEVAVSKRVDARLVQVAADAAMLAWMKALAVDPRVDRVAVVEEAAYARVATPNPIPAREQQLLAAYDGYLAAVNDPKDSERIDVTFHKANLLRRYDHFAQAIPIFEQLVAQHPDHEAAETAAHFVLDGYNRQQRYDAMLAYAEQLPAPFLAAHPALEKTVGKLRRQAVRKGAERLEAEAKQTADIPRYVACGEQYLRAYNLDPLAGDADELLYNAGVCYELGKSVGAAKQVYELLQQLFPSSTLTARSVARLGNVYGSIAYYKEAAEKLELYATKYGRQQDAFGALSDAVQFRKGIGDDVKAIADTKKFIEMFGKQRPAEAATASWSLTSIYEKQGDLDVLARHLRSYIDSYGASGGADRLVTAWGKLGQALWQASCPVKTVDGACMRVVRTASLGRVGNQLRAQPAGIPKRCGDESHAELTMVPRDDRKTKAAMAAFASAIAAYEQAGKITGDPRGALYHYALARFNRIEREYEQYLAMPIPTGLDFDRRKPEIAARSQQRFGGWYNKKLALGAAMRKQYEAIIALGDGAVAIASAARLGAILQGFSVQLFRAEIPADLRSGPFAEDTAVAYCERLEEVAEPLEADAVASYQGCLVTSTKLGWFSEWSRMCERELGQLQPERWPQAFELRRAPDAFAVIVDTETATRL
ncbi:MAG: Tetratricopeptide repeat protein [Deltaproteobacteria bacterium]|nr:Tetratricopeptide repeat protein [Deltaproteobacteria bacterium]